MITARMILDRELVKCGIDDRIFGSFIEHLGRAVYGGIFEPGHPSADREGFRADVLSLVRELRVPIIRYPGGNFVSAYKWEDGVGPAGERPRRLDLAWRSVEPNTVGVNEFARWARKAGSEIMMAVNLGTRGVEDARNLVEYCNHPAGSYWSDLRRSHGAADPHGIKVWCLGNEMDGSWQVGHKSAAEYGSLAAQVARTLKYYDPGLELVACGSSHGGMPTCPQWEADVLERCYDEVDYLSLHTYLRKNGADTETFLAESMKLDQFIRTVESTADFVKSKLRSRRTMMLSFDEWNVWYHSNEADTRVPPWTVGPRLLEDVYTQEDAVVAGCCLISLLRNADRVRMACLAQLVNVIAPIMTENGGPAWRQTIFYPFFHASLHGRGSLLETVTQSPAYSNPSFGDVPYLDAVATRNEAVGEVTVFCVNRSLKEPMELSMRLGGFGECRIIEHIVLAHEDPLAVNTKEEPGKVRPRTVAGAGFEREKLKAALPPLSWNVIRITTS